MQRKNKEYNSEIHPLLIRKIRREGGNEADVARRLGISRQCLQDWKQNYAEVSIALNENPAAVDSQIEEALIRRAIGYEYWEVYYERKPASPDGEMIEVKRVRKVAHPDLSAIKFWLSNRNPHKWSGRSDSENSRVEEFLKGIDELAKEDIAIEHTEANPPSEAS